jgi:hypothetical protein
MAKPVADTNSPAENAAGFVSDEAPVIGFSHMHDSGTGGNRSDPLDKQIRICDTNVYQLPLETFPCLFIPDAPRIMLPCANTSEHTGKYPVSRVRPKPVLGTSAST